MLFSMPKGLNEITGLRRTPIELVWLIRLRQSLTASIGELGRGGTAAEQSIDLPARIAELQEQVRCVDAVIRLHPSGLDPTCIPVVRRHNPRLYGRGEVTRAILRYLAGRKGKPATTRAIADAVGKVLGGDVAQQQPERHYRAVLLQLNALRASDRVDQVPGAKAEDARSWFLVIPTD